MAKDMLEAIFDAEEECKKREAAAKSDAEIKADKARQDALQLIKDAEAKAEANANNLFNLVNAQSKAELEAARQDAERQCAQISETAEKNRSKVIKSAVNKMIE